MATYDGLLVLDKPAGITSRAALNRVQRLFPRRTRIGHTGTLDPLATGVLVICVGIATRLAEYVQRMPKVYRATLRLGARSDTDDADGTVTPVPDAEPPTSARVHAALQQFLGAQAQVPPAYSAAKIAGRRAYALARHGATVQLPARQIEIHDLRILRYDFPELELAVHCGKGTYIRSLARDLGDALGCGAFVHALRRTSVGPFTVDGALALEADASTVRQRLRPVLDALIELPRVTLSVADMQRLRRGQDIEFDNAAQEGEAAALDGAGQVVGVVAVAGGRARPIKVLTA